MPKTWRDRLNEMLVHMDARVSLAVHIATLVASFALPAWAVRATEMFSQYAPASWVIAGFAGVVLATLVRLAWVYSTKIVVQAKANARFLERTGGAFNPLDMTFERRRIYLEDFALPSNPIVEGKTFIECDIIGPANIYWQIGNQADIVRPPKMDAICLEAKNLFTNGITFRHCIFRNCSFQRVTMFALPEVYPDWKNSPNLNWIGVPPTEEQIEDRRRQTLVGPSVTTSPPDETPVRSSETADHG